MRAFPSGSVTSFTTSLTTSAIGLGPALMEPQSNRILSVPPLFGIFTRKQSPNPTLYIRMVMAAADISLQILDATLRGSCGVSCGLRVLVRNSSQASDPPYPFDEYSFAVAPHVLRPPAVCLPRGLEKAAVC